MRHAPLLLVSLLLLAVAAPALATGTSVRVAFGSDGSISAPAGWKCEENDSTGWVPDGYTYDAIDCAPISGAADCADPEVNGHVRGANGVLRAEAHCTGSAPIAALCSASVLRFTLSPPSISPEDDCSMQAFGTVPMVVVKCVAMHGAAVRPALLTDWKVECVVTA